MGVEVFDNNTNEEIECKEGSKDDKKDEVEIGVDVHFTVWLLVDLETQEQYHTGRYRYN